MCVCVILADKIFFNIDIFLEVFQSLKIFWISKENPILNLIYEKTYSYT